MSVQIDWGALGMVFLVSFGTGVGVIVLFALGISALAAPATEPPATPGGSAGKSARPPWSRPLGTLCFLACALVVGYGLYLIIVK
ncbi:MAG: hypothetical protein ACRDRX_10520 [Pseudonocardiaceae bacterium]